jgi:glucan endo-1,3-beta-D-glucosidase
MTKLLTLLSFTLPLAPTVSTIYTGFNYGAFWGVDSNVKKTVDFQAGFSYAQNLTSKVRFNSARLFTCKTQGTVDEPTEAFDAAINTKTNLFLGFWITPANKGDPLEDIMKNELSALEKGFQKHGQALADLVIGLSVGSEDIYRSEDSNDVGVEATEVSATIKKVKDTIASSSFAAYMKDKPIGHVDTAKHAVVDGADFFGMTAYPYWNKDSIAKGQESFEAALNDLKQRAGDTPIWIAEMGWPYEGVSQGDAVASAENMQRYWNDIGCKVVDEYTTFWFELIKDSEANQPDWGVVDPVTHKPRINFSCAREQPNALNAPANSSSISPSVMSSSVLVPTTLATLPSQSVYLESSVAADQPSIPISPSALSVRRTTHITTTIIVTIQPSDAFSLPEVDDSTSTTTVTATVYTTKSSEPSSNVASVEISANSSAIAPATSAPSFAASILPSEGPWCVTMADIAWNGQYKSVDGGPAGPDGKCSPPPTYTGLPYGLGQPTAPVSSHPNVSSLSLVPSGIASPVLANPVSCSGELH